MASDAETSFIISANFCADNFHSNYTYTILRCIIENLFLRESVSADYQFFSYFHIILSNQYHQIYNKLEKN